MSNKIRSSTVGVRVHAAGPTLARNLVVWRGGPLLAALVLVGVPAFALGQLAGSQDMGWPRYYSLANGGSATIYQPQIESWKDQKRVVAWSCVSYTPPGAEKGHIGVVKATGETQVSLDNRQVDLTQLSIPEVHFAKMSKDDVQTVKTALDGALPGSLVMSLDRLLVSVDKNQVNPNKYNVKGIRTDAPKIFYRTSPSILVQFDGLPVWNSLQGLGVSYAVNTNWDVFLDDATQRYYLRDGANWLTGSTAGGDWSGATTLPPGLSQLPEDDNWKTVQANIPGHLLAGSPPSVCISTRPAELLLLNGSPAYQPVPGTNLMWVSNTDSDLFRMGKTGRFYYLVSGRWFSSNSLEGPWAFDTTSLPRDFQRIPLDHPRSRVLASVPGTDQAAEAVFLSTIPQSARVSAKTPAPPVSFQGGVAQWQKIDGTADLYRAQNTDKDILKISAPTYNMGYRDPTTYAYYGGPISYMGISEPTYFMCYNGVWFSGYNPDGPYSVTGQVPAEIYTIPPSSPIYGVTHVTAQPMSDNSGDVTCAFTPGYLGETVAYGCCMWGTGYSYPSYISGGVYYPYTQTYGTASYYNPFTGSYGRGAPGYGPYGGVMAGASFNPNTGTYSRSEAIYGPYRSGSFQQTFNPRTGTYAMAHPSSNVYANWSSSDVTRANQMALTSEGGAAMRGKGSSWVAKGVTGELYAGHNGTAYERGSKGQWQAVGGSVSTNPPTQQLNRDERLRIEGQQRVDAQSSYSQAGATRRAAGSYAGLGKADR